MNKQTTNNYSDMCWMGNQGDTLSPVKGRLNRQNTHIWTCASCGVKYTDHVSVELRSYCLQCGNNLLSIKKKKK